MRYFKTRAFNRWAGKAGVTDTVLLKAVADIERGLIDADLGSYLLKQRVALPGRGKSGSARTLLATRPGGHPNSSTRGHPKLLHPEQM